jgi:hypothetical protein
LTVNSADALIAADEARLGVSASLSYQVMASAHAGRSDQFHRRDLPASSIILCAASPRPTSALLL